MTQSGTVDIIGADEASTLPGLFLRRCARSPQSEAYRQFDGQTGSWKSYSWQRMLTEAGRWQQGLAQEGLQAGERVAIWLPNSIEWVCCDLAAQASALVVVPLYVADNPENVAFVLADSGARVLAISELAQWTAIAPYRNRFAGLRRVICLGQLSTPPEDPLVFVNSWLPEAAGLMANRASNPKSLATIVYTSGTTGRPKGVMLSHANVLGNAEAVLKVIPAFREDVFLSFLPLSHAFERTVGYYLPIMAGCTVAYARSVQLLAEDLLSVRPTVLISVPRIYERVFAKIEHGLAAKSRLARTLFEWAQRVGWQKFQAVQAQRRAGATVRLLGAVLHHLVGAKVLARLGGRLRIAVTGGAPLSQEISRFFLSLGLPLVQGYGLTEAAPVVSSNVPQDNVPESVGAPLPGITVRIGEKDELLVRGPGVMLGYWNNPAATELAIDTEGWLHTGDQARIADNRIYIVGRLKEILVMSSGEKVPPVDIESAIVRDPLFEQAMLIGEGKPYLGALLVLSPDGWRAMAESLGLPPEDPQSLRAKPALDQVLARLEPLLKGFPGHAAVRAVWLTLEPWTIENGLLTPTLKLKRADLEERFAHAIAGLYTGHTLFR